MGNSNKTKRYIIEVVQGDRYTPSHINYFDEHGNPLDIKDYWPVERQLKSILEPSAWVYIANCTYNGSRGYFKIGVTKHQDYRKRQHQLRKKFKAHITHAIRCKLSNVFEIEKKLHAFFIDYRVENEVFDLYAHLEFDAMKLLRMLKTELDVRNIREILEEHRADLPPLYPLPYRYRHDEADVFKIIEHTRKGLPHPFFSNRKPSKAG